MSDLHIVILAAGQGTRMKSARPKVLHRVAGRPMIEHVLDAASSLAPRSTVIVIGHQAEALREAMADHTGLTFVVQEPQRGTAHALLTTEPALHGARGTLVLLSGDVPLLSARTLNTLVEHLEEARLNEVRSTFRAWRPHEVIAQIEDTHRLVQGHLPRVAAVIEQNVGRWRTRRSRAGEGSDAS